MVAISRLLLNKNKDIEVFLDPYHTKIMHVMKDRNLPMTVKEIADAMGEVPAKVYYHVKKLEGIGVLSVKYTKLINGIVAKYYDFTTDTVALSVPDKDQKSNLLRSRMMKKYGACFDEAKQKFYDLISYEMNDNKLDEKVYICAKNSAQVDPKELDQFMEDFGKLVEKYRCDGGNAKSYNLFLSVIKNTDKNGKR